MIDVRKPRRERLFWIGLDYCIANMHFEHFYYMITFVCTSKKTFRIEILYKNFGFILFR